MKTFAEIYDSLKDTAEYQVEKLSLAFTESVLLRMEALGDMSGAELAERMGSSKPYVSKLLRGKGNFTLETLVKLARALECHVEPPKLVPLEHKQTEGEKNTFAQVVRFARRQKAADFSPEKTMPATVMHQTNATNADDTAAAA